MIVAGWAALVVALITCYALFESTERNLATTLLAVTLGVLFLFVCWVFGRRPNPQEIPMPTKAIPTELDRDEQGLDLSGVEL